MRVFCPEHNKGFLTPRQSPIRCESRGHVLGELDFQGAAETPADVHWQYCCNCEHFCPIDFNRNRLERCPVCTRRTSVLYLCDRCFTVSFESNTPLQMKNFTLTSDGAPDPSCPACLQEPSTDLREHECEALQARFVTALTTCPMCDERLDVAPTFPCSVAQYLRRTKAANKRRTTFDYDTELFVPVDDGEFVLVTNQADDNNAFVLPRAPRFESKRDFYELYQDYYHCPKVNPGEVHVIEPAVVQPIDGGWKLRSMGVLRVVEDQPKKRIPPDSTSRNAARNLDKPVPVMTSPEPELHETPCQNCGEVVESKYAFCWKCGSAMKFENNSSRPLESDEPTPQQDIGRIQQSILSSVPSWRRFADEDDESTVQHDSGRVRTSSSKRESFKHAGHAGSASRSILKLTAIGIVGMVLLLLGVSELRKGSAQPTPASVAQPTSSDAQANQPTVAPVEVKVPTEVVPQISPEEDELRKLRAKRMSARASDRLAILKAFAKTEKQYPNDYRFPYERAKFVVNQSDRDSHDDAFSALSAAAERAIRNDKAQEMLRGLEADKRRDFQKLARGRREWFQLIGALKSRDTKLLLARL